jgi:hypothetical protein
LRMPVNILQRTIFINSCAITLYGIVEPQYLTPFVLISIAPVNIWGNTLHEANLVIPSTEGQLVWSIASTPNK